MINPASAPATTPPPFAGPWAAGDTRLDRLVRYPLPGGAGPEDVVVDAEGRPVSGADDGRIWRWPATSGPGTSGSGTSGPAGDAPELLADIGGRPLGLEVDPRDGSLIVCDAHRG